MAEYWAVRPEEAYSLLGTSPAGLAPHEAQLRLARYGANEIEPPEKKTALRIFISQFQNPLIYVLLAATAIAGFMGEQTEALIILAIVCVNAILGFAQEYRSEKALEHLRKYLSMSAHVIREGHIAEVNTKQLVPGDVILVSIGDIVPADARLVEVHELETNESVLTGESNPVPKSAGPLGLARPMPQELANTVFMGTTVSAGSGKAVVAATGRETHLGKTAGTLKAPEALTDFEKSIRQFGTVLVNVILVMTAFIFIVNTVLGHGLLTSLLFALALAVGITPELLPIIITLGLSSGAMRLVQKHVAVRRLDAIEDLGNIDVLCADKTGTLTENVVSLIRYVDCEGRDDEKILLYGLLCNSAVVHDSHVKGGTIDAAIWTYALPRFDLDRLKGYRQVDAMAFDYDRKRMSVVVEAGGERLLIMKGAPEKVIAACSRARYGGKEEPVSRHAVRLTRMVREFNENGYRVVAVASKKIAAKQDYTRDDEGNAVLLGYLVLLDPPKKDAQPALEHFRNLGVRVMVLTGDSPAVTGEICRQVGIEAEGGRIISGADIEEAGAAGALAAKYNIYARLTPAHKLAIVKALRADGHIVGFVGDGVNDAPALREADVGISVRNGADIARDAADVVLLRKSLNVIADGISEGRKTFANIMKYIRNTISANFGNMFTVAGASLFLPFIPLLPSQILLNNLLSDMPMLTVSTDRVDREGLRKPKKWDLKAITKFMVFFGLISSVFDFLTMGFILFMLHADVARFRTIWFLESLLSEIFVVFAIRTAKPLYKSLPSPLLVGMTAVVTLGAVGAIQSPLGAVFEFEPLTPHTLGIVFGIVLLYVAVVEVAKRRFYASNGAA